jgi:hypothetical protein
MNRLTAFATGACAPLLLAAVCAGCAGEADKVRAAAALPPPPHLRFEFHSAMLMNLHHFLYDAARHPERLEQAPWAVPPTAQELAALNDAVAFYAQHYAKQDLLFDADMTAIKHGLSVQDDARARADGLALPPELVGVLDRAAPAYVRVLWPAHLQADQLWINNVSTLNARYGDEIQARLVHAFAHKFVPDIRVDVVYETGSLTGAYTGEAPPQTVMPSSRASYNAEASLEMLWHEAAHTGAVDALSAEIDADVKAFHRAPADQLWHATQFYTVGYVVQDVYSRQAGLDYAPYASKNGVYARGWAAYFPLIDSDWQAWLGGRGTMRQAVEKMVKRLPPA